uniref:Uncharacterized protein n=1 Tax=Romanomermis culicivorax TaxID=13658 RepID=A0A915IWD8_ROMCU
MRLIKKDASTCKFFTIYELDKKIVNCGKMARGSQAPYGIEGMGVKLAAAAAVNRLLAATPAYDKLLKPDEHKLIRSEPTRWITDYYMLNRLLEQRMPIYNALMDMEFIYLDERTNDYFEDSNYLLATGLDPRFKFEFFDETRCCRVKNELHSKILDLKMQQLDDPNYEPSIPEKRTKNNEEPCTSSSFDNILYILQPQKVTGEMTPIFYYFVVAHEIMSGDELAGAETPQTKTYDEVILDFSIDSLTDRKSSPILVSPTPLVFSE